MNYDIPKFLRHSLLRTELRNRAIARKTSIPALIVIVGLCMWTMQLAWALAQATTVYQINLN